MYFMIIHQGSLPTAVISWYLNSKGIGHQFELTDQRLICATLRRLSAKISISVGFGVEFFVECNYPVDIQGENKQVFRSEEIAAVTFESVRYDAYQPHYKEWKVIQKQ